MNSILDNTHRQQPGRAGLSAAFRAWFAPTAAIVQALALAGLFLTTSCGRNAAVDNYPKVHRSDELAANPGDPDRMSAGVKREQIIPRLALEASEAAVREHPRTPRFHYQLGRALAASGRPIDAIKCYEKAAAMGYRMANYNLGVCYADGDGVPIDMEKGIAYLEKAANEGVEAAKQQLASLVFSSEGFSDPGFFTAVYEGEFEDIGGDQTGLATYLLTFVNPIINSPQCGQVVTHYTVAKLRQHAGAAVLARYFGALVNAKKDHVSGDFVGAAAAGYNAGNKLNLDFATMIGRGHQDAQLFYDRYGCASPIAQRFFSNIDELTKLLGSPSFGQELKKNVR